MLRDISILVGNCNRELQGALVGCVEKLEGVTEANVIRGRLEVAAAGVTRDDVIAALEGDHFDWVLNSVDDYN